MGLFVETSKQRQPNQPTRELFDRESTASLLPMTQCTDVWEKVLFFFVLRLNSRERDSSLRSSCLDHLHRTGELSERWDRSAGYPEENHRWNARDQWFAEWRNRFYSRYEVGQRIEHAVEERDYPKWKIVEIDLLFKCSLRRDQWLESLFRPLLNVPPLLTKDETKVPLELGKGKNLTVIRSSRCR